MRRILLSIIFFVFGVFSMTVYAEGEVIDISSNPDEMIILESAPKAFMYIPPYQGFLDNAKEFTVDERSTANVTAAHDNDKSSYANILTKGYVEYTFKTKQNIGSYYAYVKSTGIFEVQFYDENRKLLKTFENEEAKGVKEPIEVIKNVNLTNVKTVILTTQLTSYTSSVYEFEVNTAEVFLPVSNVTSISTEKSIKMKWELPDHKNLTDIKVNGISVGKVTEYTDTNLESNKEYVYNISAVYLDGTEINTVYKTLTLEDKTPPGKIENLQVEQKGNNVNLSYKFPSDEDFEYVVIKRDGDVIANQHKNTTFTDTKLLFGREYMYELIAFDKSGNASDPVMGKITLVTQEVFNLIASAKKYNEVELNWILPNAEGLEKVVIYRKNNDVGFLSKLFKSNEIALFETNGTQFKDLTVSADTSYTYRLTSVYSEETQGITVTIKTPKVTVDGGNTEKDENGDYIITWNEPTKGKIKVLVGGVQFAVVPTTDKRVVIPKNKMKFDLFGNPDVQLIPIDEEGNIGIPSRPGGENGGGGNGGIGDIVGGETAAEILNAKNVLISGVSLLGIVGAFLLLGLSFRVVPKLIQMIRTALGEKNKKDSILPGTGRRTQ